MTTETKEPAYQTHRNIARIIAEAHRLRPDITDLTQQIISALDTVRSDERAFWTIAVKNSIDTCEQRGMHEAANVLRLFLATVEEASTV